VKVPTLALVHTVHPVIPEFESLCRRLLPRARTAHFLDETTLRDVMAHGGLKPEIVRRVCDLVILAERGGADAVLVTCSSIGPAVDAARGLVAIPVRRVDGPMAASAARRGGRIGVAATVATTLEPTAALIRDESRRRGKRVRIIRALFAGAFDARMAGDPARHDEIVRRGLAELAERVDTIVLAQATMARVASKLDLPARVRVLSSPESGVRQMRRLLASAGSRDRRPAKK